MLVIPFGKKPDDSEDKHLKEELDVKEDKYDALSVLCMADEVDMVDLRDRLVKCSYRDNSEEYWSDPENMVDILEELEKFGSIEINGSNISITDKGLEKWKKTTVEHDVDPNIYV
jgi:predicted methyltransferase